MPASKSPASGDRHRRRRRRRRLRRPHRRPPSQRPTGPPHDHSDGVNVFDYYFQERTVGSRSRCMRITMAQHRPNASLITPTRPRLALQRYADHLPRALRLSLPVRRFRHLHRL